MKNTDRTHEYSDFGYGFYSGIFLRHYPFLFLDRWKKDFIFLAVLLSASLGNTISELSYMEWIQYIGLAVAIL